MTDHTPLTVQQLADIEARVAAATPGPWHLTDAATIVAPLTGTVIADVWEPTHESGNGEFIENARTDMDALLAEVRRLRARIAELEPEAALLSALYAGGVDNWDGYDDAREAAAAAVSGAADSRPA